jgi:hypothetical protein
MIPTRLRLADFITFLLEFEREQVAHGKSPTKGDV